MNKLEREAALEQALLEWNAARQEAYSGNKSATQIGKMGVIGKRLVHLLKTVGTLQALAEIRQYILQTGEYVQPTPEGGTNIFADIVI